VLRFVSLRVMLLSVCSLASLALFVLVPGAWAQSNSRLTQGTASAKRQEGQLSAKAQASLAFVSEYVRELAAIEILRDSSEQSLKQGSSSDEFSNAIYSGTRMQLELRSQINVLRGMRLAPPFETLIPSLIKFYEHKIELYQKLIDISSTFLRGPRPGVDYDKLAVEIQQLRAQLDYTDNALLEAAPLIFQTLVDSRADSQNHISHLLITGSERAQLITEIDSDFGSKLDGKDSSYQVGAAAVLKAGLLEDFKSSNDPWK
jgi:hypothetical protein